MKLVRLVALDMYDNELGAIDGAKLTIWTTDDGEIQVDNGAAALFRGLAEVPYDWSDLVGADYGRGTPIRLELTIIDTEDQPLPR